MLSNYKFPRDFSDRVTLLLSEPRDFGQRYSYDTDYGSHLRGINEILDNLRTNNGKIARKGLSNEAKRAANQYGINLDSVDSDTLSGLVKQRIQPKVDIQNETYGLESDIAKRKLVAEKTALEQSEFDRLPISQKIAHKISSRLGKNYNHETDDAGKFISENAGDYVRERGKDIGGAVKSIKENATTVFDDITGFKGSKQTRELNAERSNYIKNARSEAGRKARVEAQAHNNRINEAKNKAVSARVAKDIDNHEFFHSDEDREKYKSEREKFYQGEYDRSLVGAQSKDLKLRDADKEAKLAEDSFDVEKASKKFDEDNARAIRKAKDKDSTLRARKIMGGVQSVGTAVDAGLDMISSKHRAQTLATQGHAGVARKQARLAQLLGDKSFTTRVVAGNWGGSMRGWGDGMGIKGAIGSLFSKGVDKINPVSHKIRSNEANYQKSARYFSEQENLSWQPEEYMKLKMILEREYENPEDFSENQDDKQQIPFDGQGFYDASDEVDITSLTPEKAEKILNRTYYNIPDDEKRYQESIAKGFSEELNSRKSYENFLNECSEIYDISSWR